MELQEGKGLAMQASWYVGGVVSEQNPKVIKAERRAVVQPNCGYSQGEAKELDTGSRNPLKVEEAEEEMCHGIPGTKEFNYKSSAWELERK